MHNQNLNLIEHLVEMVLYFGCRQCRIDELYRSEIDKMIRKNIITSYYGAYSREPNLKKVNIS